MSYIFLKSIHKYPLWTCWSAVTLWPKTPYCHQNNPDQFKAFSRPLWHLALRHWKVWYLVYNIGIKNYGQSFCDLTCLFLKSQVQAQWEVLGRSNHRHVGFKSKAPEVAACYTWIRLVFPPHPTNYSLYWDLENFEAWSTPGNCTGSCVLQNVLEPLLLFGREHYPGEAKWCLYQKAGIVCSNV